MTNTKPHEAAAPAAPSRHQQALLVWIAVLPTLSLLQIVLGRVLVHLPVALRGPMVATFAVPIMVYLLIPRLQKLARWISARRISAQRPTKTKEI
jgi:antibiotic biosynthesis monooxygenase (ABM) superfamily enzyme